MQSIALDIGQVLCYVDTELFIDGLLEYRFFNDTEQANAFIKYQSHYIDIGITTMEKELRKINTQNIDELMYIWNNDILTPSFRMADIVKYFLENNYLVALLSNIGYEHAKIVRERFPDIYKECIHHFSCDVGARKPSKLYFQSFLIDHPHFREGIFFDDRLENIEAAKKAGFRIAHQFDLSTKKSSEIAALEFRNLVHETLPGLDIGS